MWTRPWSRWKLWASWWTSRPPSPCQSRPRRSRRPRKRRLGTLIQILPIQVSVGETSIRNNNSAINSFITLLGGIILLFKYLIARIMGLNYMWKDMNIEQQYSSTRNSFLKSSKYMKGFSKQIHQLPTIGVKFAEEKKTFAAWLTLQRYYKYILLLRSHESPRWRGWR